MTKEDGGLQVTMSLRDHFASVAMSCLISKLTAEEAKALEAKGANFHHMTAIGAYSIADAMLKERAVKQ